MAKKKKEFLKVVNSKMASKDQKLTKDESKRWAEEWMEYADEDGNGFIDLNEFKNFVKSIDKKKTISAYMVVNTFKTMDDDKNG